MSKVLRKIFVGLAGAFVIVLVVAWLISSHFEVGPPTIPPAKALALLNDCNRFTHIGQNTREAIAVTKEAKGGPHADDGAYYSTAQVNWRWISGPKSKVDPESSAQATFLWNPVHGGPGDLRDWNFPEGGWVVKEFSQADDEPSFDCTTAELIQ